DQAQHLPARPRALVEDALQPVGADRQVAHLETVERNLGVAPPSQEGAHAREIDDRARQPPGPPGDSAATPSQAAAGARPAVASIASRSATVRCAPPRSSATGEGRKPSRARVSAGSRTVAIQEETGGITQQ